MFFYEPDNGNLCFEIDGTDYIVEGNCLMKYNYSKRNENRIVQTEFIEKDELEKIAIELVTLMYKQNKKFAETIIRGI